MLLLVDFSGPMRDRLRAQAPLALTGAVFVAWGRSSPRRPGSPRWRWRWWRSGVPLRGRRQLGAGRRDDLAAAGVHPAGLAARPGVLDPRPARRLGPGLGRGAAGDRAAVAGAGARPGARRRDRRLPGAGRRACGPRSPTSWATGSDAERRGGGRRSATRPSRRCARTFFATPYRPTGLTTAARAVVRLVDELQWLNAVVAARPAPADGGRSPRLRGQVRGGGRARPRRRPARPPASAARGAAGSARRRCGPSSTSSSASATRMLPDERRCCPRSTRASARRS